MALARRTGSQLAFAAIAASLTALIASGVLLAAQSRREFAVSGVRYAFHISDSSAAEIRVRQNDLVHITFTAEDIPHSFTIEAPYRIMRRAEPGKPVAFDFRADQVGRFPFFCNLTIDEKCKDMRGVLVVDPAQ